MVSGFDLPARTLTDEAFLNSHVDATPALVLTSQPVEPFWTAADHVTEYAAIFAQTIRHCGGREDQRLGWQTVRNRWQRTGFDKRIKEWCLIVAVQRAVAVKIITADEFVLQTGQALLRWHGFG